MKQRIVFAIVWMISAILFWKWYLLPTALTEVPEGDQRLVAFGVFWGIVTILVSIYLIFRGKINKPNHPISENIEPNIGADRAKPASINHRPVLVRTIPLSGNFRISISLLCFISFTILVQNVFRNTA